MKMIEFTNFNETISGDEGERVLAREKLYINVELIEAVSVWTTPQNTVEQGTAIQTPGRVYRVSETVEEILKLCE